MRYPADMHVHSTFSVDSDCGMGDHIESAIEKGIKTVCFTEHYDLNPFDEGVGFYRYGAVSDEINRLRDVYGDRVNILKGIEFSEPHLYPREFEACTRLDYDYLLASVHFVDDFFILDRKKTASIPDEKLAERYYGETLKMVRFGGFEAVAHFDYLRRNITSDLFEKDILREIFSVMANQGIALEINSQNLRRGIEFPFPNPEKVRLYSEAGGSRVVYGSDGHHKGDLGSGIEEAFVQCKDIPGLTPGIYVQRSFARI